MCLQATENTGGPCVARGLVVGPHCTQSKVRAYTAVITECEQQAHKASYCGSKQQ